MEMITECNSNKWEVGEKIEWWHVAKSQYNKQRKVGMIAQNIWCNAPVPLTYLHHITFFDIDGNPVVSPV